ncbi:MAG: hypothetical protein FWH11_07690 [Micrococcales bacterium]|nr:hypothetical protein [Micrococcales bacterium]
MDTTRWQVPRLTARPQLVSEVAILVVGLVLIVLVAVFEPRAWWLSVLVVLVLTYLLVVVLTERTWFDPDAVSRRRWSPRPATLALADVTQVAIQARGATGAALVLQGRPSGARRGTTIAVPLVQVTMFDARTQSPDVTRRLADTVVDLPGGKDAAMHLRAHATHTAGGGAPERSSLLDR